MIRFLLPLSLLLTPGFVANAFADPVKISSELLKETVVETASGPSTIQTPFDSAAPGDTIIVRLTYSNDGVTPASDVVISNPLPEQLGFLEARDGGVAQVSVDGGKTFGALIDLKVTVDGKKRSANASDVTHVRWRIAQPVAPGQSGAVAFAARLN